MNLKPAALLGTGAMAAGLLVSVAVVAPMPESADAFPVRDRDCFRETGPLSYFFQNAGRAWQGFERTRVDDGFDQWRNYRNRSANRLADNFQVGSTTPGAIPIRRVQDQSVNNTSCPNGFASRITLGRRGTALIRSAAHESGHSFGLSHAGDQDSHPFAENDARSRPLMQGCARQDNPPRNDDLAQLSFNRDSRAQTSDMGFENDIGAWFGNWTLTTSAPFDGNRAMLISQGNTIESRPVRVTSPRINQRIAVRYIAAGQTKIKFKYRPVNYSGSSCNPGQFTPDGFNWDTPFFPGGSQDWRSHLVTLPARSSWRTSNTAVPAPAGGPNGGNTWAQWDAIDVAVSYYAENSNAKIDELVSFSL